MEIPYCADDLDQMELSLHETITRIRASAIRRPGAALPDRLQKLRHPLALPPGTDNRLARPAIDTGWSGNFWR